jgi:acyl carrier protein
MMMTDFLREMEDILDMPSLSLNEKIKLADCESWDSLAMLAFTIMASERFNREIPGRSLRNVETVGDLYELSTNGTIAHV